jgi:signal transduction histidine kinase
MIRLGLANVAGHWDLLTKASGPVLVAFAYYLGAEAAFLVGTLSDNIFAPFWPPNIILFCALMLVPYQSWPLYIGAVLPAHLIAELGVGMSWPQLWIAFATNCMVAMLNAFGVRYLLGEPPWLNTFHKALVYVLVAAVASPAVSALGGAFVRIAGGAELGNYWLYWEEWYAANALASLTLGAVLLAWIAKRSDWAELSSYPRWMEALLLGAGITLACVVAFKADALTMRSYLPAFLYLPLPLIVWAAVRFRMVGASAAILIVTITSIFVTLQGPTVFVGANMDANVLSLQLFLMAVSLPTLLLGASIDGLRRAEQTAGALARFVLGAQDEERRKIAKGLHDDIAQNLVAATWMTERLQRELPRARQANCRELEEVLQRSITDVRALSYLIHPPLLDEAGLEWALRARMDSYHKCSGIAVELEFAGKLGRLPPDVELTIFRLVEEALSNIKRHSESPTARICIERRGGAEGIELTIEDAGRGIPGTGNGPARLQGLLAADNAPGLGLARMRERLGRVGGKLMIQSAAGKTILQAVIPLAERPIEGDYC